MPSSTRAELTALAVFINIIPQTSKLIVNTDSQALITVMETYKHPRSCKRWKKYKNPYLFQVINEMIKQKQLSLTFNKVKVHSGIPLHDKADELAKLGRTQNNPITFNISASSSF